MWNEGMAVILMAVAVVAAGCAKKTEERERVTPPVMIFRLPEAGEATFRNFPGEVTAKETVRLSFDVGGRLIEFPVYDGQVVGEGDFIGQLDPADFQAAVDSATATYNTARQEFERQKTLRQRNVISQSELDRHRMLFERAEAALRTAQNSLTETRLAAPFKGRISRRFVRNFQTVQAREPIVLLQNTAFLDVEVQIPEALMASVNANTTAAEAAKLIEARASFAAIPGEIFPIALRSFSTQANPSSRTFLITFNLHAPSDRNILPGMTCAVQLRFRAPDGSPVLQEGLFQVPARALVTSAEGASVWRWEEADGRVTRVPVEIVGLNGDFATIRGGGLAAGKEIVASGARFLSEGDTVRRMEERQP